MLKRRIVAACLAACMAMALAATGCSGQGSSEQEAEPSPQAQEDRGLMGSTEPVEVNIGLIIGPPSMGLSQAIVDAQNGETYNDFDFTVTGMDYQALAASFNQGDYDIVTLPSNLGPIIYNNDELQTDVQVVSLGNLGVLYGITTDPAIQTLDDLAGRTVYSYGEGGTPEYTIAYLMNQAGLADEVNVNFRSTPFEVLNLLQEEPNAVAILPQPFVEVAKLLVPGLMVPIDLTEEWDRINADTGSQVVTTATFVNREFLENHEQAVLEYLEITSQSVEWTHANVDEAASRQEDLGTFLSNDVAVDAIPQCSIVCMTGEEMKTALSGFLQALYELNPESIGGSVPGDDFYYIPPDGLEVPWEEGAADGAPDAGEQGQAQAV